MDRLHTMQVFVEVAKHRSFVAASEQLNLSAAAVTRAIAALEQRLDVKLFHRTTRHVRLTESGERYLTDTKRILDDIDESEAAAAGLYAKPSGILSITAPVLFGEMHVMPIVTEYLAKHPAVSIRAVFSDRITSLQEDDLDIAIRIGHLSDSGLFATEVGHVRRIICGAPDYFQQHGIPQVPTDLHDHQIIFPTMHSPSAHWGFQVDGRTQVLKLTPRLHCFQGGAAINAALQGAGITRVMSYQVGDQLADGRLMRVLSEFEEPPLPVNILRLEGRRMNAKIRSFLDLATACLKVNPYIREQ